MSFRKRGLIFLKIRYRPILHSFVQKPLRMDLHQILHRRRGPQRNHLWQNLLATRLRCRFVGGQKSLFSIDNPMRSSLTQEWRYRTCAPVIGLQLLFYAMFTYVLFSLLSITLFLFKRYYIPQFEWHGGSCMHNGGIRKQKRWLLLL